MKRMISFVLTCVLLLSGCTHQTSAETPPLLPSEPLISDNNTQVSPKESGPNINIPFETEQEVIPSFNSLNDPHLLRYVEDNIYAGLVDNFSSEDYIIENVSAIYCSKEYLEEAAYNSKDNIFFGYTLAELDEQFQGTRYVFTLNDNGETTVVPFEDEDYDDTYEQVIKNVAIGTGVILVCVTVSAVTGAAGMTTVSMIFAASAKTAATFALSSAGFSGVCAGVVSGIQTKDFDQAIRTAALASSESFKWGAISGALAGGLNVLDTLHHPELKAENLILGQSRDEDKIPQWKISEDRVLNIYGGEGQRAFQNGHEVPYNTANSTRPDVVRTIGDHLEAIEVKNYNLENSNNLSTLYHELERQVSDRITNCPPGTTQRIVLDVTERNFSQELVTNVVQTIQTRLFDIYPNIPVDVLGL